MTLASCDKGPGLRPPTGRHAQSGPALLHVSATQQVRPSGRPSGHLLRAAGARCPRSKNNSNHPSAFPCHRLGRSPRAPTLRGSPPPPPPAPGSQDISSFLTICRCLLPQPPWPWSLSPTLALSHDPEPLPGRPCPPPAPLSRASLSGHECRCRDQCAHSAVGSAAQTWAQHTAECGRPVNSHRGHARGGDVLERPPPGLGGSGPWAALAPPRVPGISRCLPFLNLLLIKKQMKG